MPTATPAPVVPAGAPVFDPLVTKLAAARGPHNTAVQALNTAKQAWQDGQVAWGLMPAPPVTRPRVVPVTTAPAPAAPVAAAPVVSLPDLNALATALVAAMKTEASLAVAVQQAQVAVNEAMKTAGAA